MPQPLVNLVAASETSHLAECYHRLARVFTAVGVDLTGRGVSSVQQYLQLHQEWYRQVTGPPFSVVHALDTDIVRCGSLLPRCEGRRDK